MPQPSFVLARDGHGCRGEGVTAGFDAVAPARAALAAGSAPVVTGALGFDTAAAAALTVPERWSHSAPLRAHPPRPARLLAETLTPAAEHAARVRAALAAIDAGTVAKVVLARQAEWTLESAVAPTDLLAAFAHIGPGAAIFGATLDAAPGHAGQWLLGASPELLVRRAGRTVTCHPYAGSAPRQADPVADQAAAQQLLQSSKDLAEHAFVVADLRTRLAPLCVEVDVPARPVLMSTGEMWHLATPIRGRLADDTVTALDLAALLSPTPAVGGTPTDAATALITELEGPREFYAGTVGWCDAAGDGEWLVSIRCLELGADHRTVRAWAGGGIVADSDPDAEVAETTAKFRTARRALGLDPIA
ncbi:isochorismate synthase [Gordonia alkaliphila]|uniref:isochorismate synthase n=1 Tax=Gordonia alkaliphila TaxID=1053547 RepID=A0ABP8YSZ8_9ACTN